MNTPGDDRTDAARLMARTLRQARVARAHGDDAMAEELLTNVLASNDPATKGSALYALALARIDAQRDVEAALEYLQDATEVAADNHDVELLLNIADAYLRVGHPLCSKTTSELALELTQDLRRTASGDRAQGLLRYYAALANLQLAKSARRLDPPGDPMKYLRDAAHENDPAVSPFALIELAVDSAVHGSDPAGFLRQARNYGHPAASSEATFELGALHAWYGRTKDACKYFERVRTLSADPRWAERAATAIAALPATPESRIGTALDRAPMGFEPVHDRGRRREVAVVGGGMGGKLLVQALARNPRIAPNTKVIGFVDDDPEVEHRTLDHLGPIDALPDLLRDRRPHEVLIAMPSVAPSVKMKAVRACLDAGVSMRTLPTMHEVARPGDLVDHLRPVRLDDLFGDVPPTMDEPASMWLRGHRVLIVGAGALGRQLAICAARAGAARIVVVDRDQVLVERRINELSSKYGFRHAAWGQVRAFDAEKIVETANEHGATVMFHTVSQALTGAATNAPDVVAKDRIRRRNIIDGLERLIDRLSDCRQLTHFTWVADAAVADPSTAGRALGAVMEAIVLSSSTVDGPLVRTSVRSPALYTSRSGWMAVMQQDAVDRLPLRVPRPHVKGRFEHGYRVAELALHATTLARDGEVFSVTSGQDVSIRAAAELLLRLEGRDDGKVITTETRPNLVPPGPGPRGAATGVPGLDLIAGAEVDRPTRESLHRLRGASADELVEFARSLPARPRPAPAADRDDAEVGHGV